MKKESREAAYQISGLPPKKSTPLISFSFDNIYIYISSPLLMMSFRLFIFSISAFFPSLDFSCLPVRDYRNGQN